MCLINASELKRINGSQIIKPQDGFIYWHIREDKMTSDFDKYKVILSFENGFKELEKVFYPIQFKSTSDPKQAPIVMGFYKKGDAGLPQPFGSNTLAYAYGNYEGFEYAADIFFNDAYKWAEMNKSGQEINLKKVFVHECLHALGFDHSDDAADIMYWQYQDNDEIVFSKDTQDSIKLAYKAEMEKIKPSQPTDEQSIIKKFCIDVLEVKKNRNWIPVLIFVNISNYFGIQLGKSATLIKDNLIKFLYG